MHPHLLATFLFWGGAKLIDLRKCGRIWAKLGGFLVKIEAKVINIWANLISFGQNQNFASLKSIRSPTTKSWKPF